MSLLDDKNEYWGSFYKNKAAPDDPSSFAIKCSSIAKPNSRFLEIGCGNCRDANFLAKNHSVIAVDGNSCNSFASDKVFFAKSNIEDLVDIECDYIYSRFFIHAVPEGVEDMFWDYVKRNSSNFFVEARSDKSSFEGDHYRRFINKAHLEEKLSSLGFRYEIQESKGLAILGDQDPFVIRVLGSVH